ncbi:hypothetical protein DH2020_035356 [Rehmannia glutinosa]|uniref:Uncharacterized protein n=1 Tax=Rehmannia glutinosa TaxID=99300 RepID=A0ABR0V7C8_REHGL
MIKTTPPKALAMRINLVFLAFFFVLYSILLLCPFSSDDHQEQAASLVRCSLSECQHKMGNGIKMKSMLEEPNKSKELIKREKPSFLSGIGRGMKIGMVNIDDEDVFEWKPHGEIIRVSFEQVSDVLEWKDLFPEWIDEEEEIDGPSCPEIPMPDFDKYEKMDMIVAKLPSKAPEGGWNRDVFRLQVHLVVANLAARRGRWDWKGNMKVVFLSKCMPMVEIFRCDELVRREGDWWYYSPEMGKLKQKVSLPVGSCNLAMPLWGKAVNPFKSFDDMSCRNQRSLRRFQNQKPRHQNDTKKRSLRNSSPFLRSLRLRRNNPCPKPAPNPNPTRPNPPPRHLNLPTQTRRPFPGRVEPPVHQTDPKPESREKLLQRIQLQQVPAMAAHRLRQNHIHRLRRRRFAQPRRPFQFPPNVGHGQRRIDLQFGHNGDRAVELHVPHANEPQERDRLVQWGRSGFLNEVFVWWHRLPRRVNFLKNFWSNSSNEATVKNQLFGSDPPKLYSIHFLGLKPWLCYRDYDCNWDIPSQRVYASDVAHARWWRVYDAMDEALKGFCGLPEYRKIELEWDRKKARKLGLEYRHWKINVTDPRRFI